MRLPLLSIVLALTLSACGSASREQEPPSASTTPAPALGKDQRALREGLDALADDLNALDAQVRECVSRPDLDEAPSYAEVRGCIREKWAFTSQRIDAFARGVVALRLPGLGCGRARDEFVAVARSSSRRIEHVHRTSAQATDARLQADAGHVGDAVRAVVLQMDRILVPCRLDTPLVD